ncbi:hypothetical protein ACFQ2H_00320 [Streptomyces violaceoruber]
MLEATSGALPPRRATGMLHCTGRTTPLARAVAVPLAGLLVRQQAGIRGRAPPVHRGLGRATSWTSPSFGPGSWGVVDVARDAAGRRRHPVRLHRARPDVDPGTVPLFST